MQINIDDVKKVSKLSRIKISEDQEKKMLSELRDIFTWIEQLNEVSVENVEPLIAVGSEKMHERKDVITDGKIIEKVMANAPKSEDDFFVIPKVIE